LLDYIPDAGYALFLWWFSTGLVLYLNGLSAHTFHRSLIGATFVLALALIGLSWSAGQASVFAAYISFTCGLLIYAWQELSYYMGFVTGPRKTTCAEGCSGWSHFGHALQANLYHEAATIVGAVAVIMLSWGAPNQVGMWTYLLLWGMQLSAKLNVFLGVRNLSEEFLPAHMQHLRSFLKRRSMNPLFPFSIAVGTYLTYWLVQLAMAAEAGTFAAVGWTFLASLMALAVLEHWFLVLPFSATGLWQWWLDLRAGDSGRSGGDLKREGAGGGKSSRPGVTRASAISSEDSDNLDKSVYLLRGQ